MIKRLMAHSFIEVLDKELKFLAMEDNDYYIYNMWKKRNYRSLTSLKLRQLKTLDLSFLGLRTLPYEISYFENLEEINLSGNYLKDLPSELFNLKKLKILNLGDIISGGNKLCHLSKDIEKLENLEVLKLVWNDDLQELPYEIINLKNLKLITLSQKEILNTRIGKEIQKRYFVYFEDYK